MNNFNFHKKNVIISGGGTGIGYAIAKSFHLCGADVVIVGRRKHILEEAIIKIEAEQSNSHGSINSVHGDLSQEDFVKDLFGELVSRQTTVDILVNNSSTWENIAISDLSIDGVDSQYNNIFKTTVLCTKYVNQCMVEGGVIVNIGSFAGELPMKNSSIYSSLKSAIRTFTRSAAAEYGQEGIRVNCVIPGVIRTPMTSDYLDMHYDQLIQPIALGRFGSCQDVANGVMFLSSDLASYITGASLEVTGGKFISQL